MGARQVIQGVVVSDKMDKTVVVSVERRKKHRLYHKVIKLTTRFKAHDENNSARLGDMVVIEESRPYSRDKRWRLVNIISRGDVAEIRPDAIGRELEAATQVAPKHEADDTDEAPESTDSPDSPDPEENR